MANETTLTTVAARPTDVYSDSISAALVARVVIVPLIHSEDLPTNTTVKYVKKDGALTASASAVSEASSYSTYSALTTSGVSMTAIKDVCASFITVEAQKFGGVDRALIARKQGEALARRLDNEVAALFNAHDHSVTCASVMTVDDLIDASYNVRKNTVDVASPQLKAVLGLKAVNSLRKELVKSAASVYTMPQMATLLTGAQGQGNGYAGSLPGIDVYAFAGTFPTANGDDYQLVFDPAICYTGMYDASPSTVEVWTATGNPSFGLQVASWVFHAATEWNDDAGCTIRSDT